MMRGRRRVALVPSEPLRPEMAGIGIRYAEMARHLDLAGLTVILIQPGDPALAEPLRLPLAEIRRFERGQLAALVGDCDVAVSQGQLANDLLIEAPNLPTAIDLYDPFLVENMHYLESLGLDPYRNDHATWVLQMSRGDFFLCSCEEQRLFYLGFLAALGRVHPIRAAADPDFAGLIATVPFGVPAQVPPHRELLPPRYAGERRLLFGGLYDWYDPWPLLEAVAEHADQPWRLLFIRIPNAGTPQRLLGEVVAWAKDHRLIGHPERPDRIQILDWLPSERRYDLLRDVDVLVATHRLNLETRLSLRTRFLDALAVGCPVLSSEGGAISRWLQDREAGWVVPVGDAKAIGRALVEILGGGPTVESHRRAALQLAETLGWSRSLEPLVAFCQDPKPDRTKDDFAFRPTTHTPKDPWVFRLRRRLRRWFATRAIG